MYLRSRSLALILLLCILLSLTLQLVSHTNDYALLYGVEGTREFLEKCYVYYRYYSVEGNKAYAIKDTGLLVEHVNSSVMFVAPDNYLAVGALYFLNSSYWRRVACGVLVLSGGYDFPPMGLYGVLCGRVVNVSWPPRYSFIVDVGELRELRNGKLHYYHIRWRFWFGNRSIGYWSFVPTYLALGVVHYVVKGDLSRAKDCMDKLIGMWDGYGFMGYKGSRRYYAFNLALAYFAYRVLRKVKPDWAKEYSKVMEEVREVAFSLLNGGICNEYEVRDGEVKPIGPPTVFSTSLFVLAFYSPLPEIVAEGRDFLTFIRDKLSEELGPPIWEHIAPGSRLIVTAPHAIRTYRLVRWNNRTLLTYHFGEVGVYKIVKNLVSRYNCSGFYWRFSGGVDANYHDKLTWIPWKPLHPLKQKVLEMIGLSARYLVDIHGMRDAYGVSICIGTGYGAYCGRDIIDRIMFALKPYNSTEIIPGQILCGFDELFFGGYDPGRGVVQGTMSHFAWANGLKALQLELSYSFRKLLVKGNQTAWHILDLIIGALMDYEPPRISNVIVKVMEDKVLVTFSVWDEFEVKSVECRALDVNGNVVSVDDVKMIDNNYTCTIPLSLIQLDKILITAVDAYNNSATYIIEMEVIEREVTVTRTTTTTKTYTWTLTVTSPVTETKTLTKTITSTKTTTYTLTRFSNITTTKTLMLTTTAKVVEPTLQA